MMSYILDTNIILTWLRKAPLWEDISKKYQPDFTNTFISIVTVGELQSIAYQNSWGAKKLLKLESVLGELAIIDIRHERIIKCYAEIDAYSQGRHKSLKANFTARNMGKNDLWIAATTMAVGAKLMTTDKDFTHLDGVFFELAMPAQGNPST